MNKTLEYMAYALPSVAFDLVETRVSDGDSVLYVPSGHVTGIRQYSRAAVGQPRTSPRDGLRARARVCRELDWRPQAQAYVTLYDELSGRRLWKSDASDGSDVGLDPGVDDRGRPYVDLNKREEFERFILQRTSSDCNQARSPSSH
jgi:hypothetical protein